MKRDFLWTLMLSAFMGAALVACSDDDNDSNPAPEDGGSSSETTTVEKYIIAASGASSGGSSSPTYVIDTESLDEGTASILSGGGSTQIGTNESYTHWLFPDNKWVFALQYNQGNDAVMRYGFLNESGSFELSSMESSMPRFSAFGTIDKYVVLAANGELDQYNSADTNKEHPMQGLIFSVIDPEGPSNTNYNYVTENLFNDGEYYTISGFVPVNGKIYSAFIPSGFSDYGCTYNEEMIPEQYKDQIVESDGVKSLSTLHPNKLIFGVYDDVTSFGAGPSKWITFDEDESRISLPHSRYRSQYYATFCTGADNYLYIFSNNLYRTNTTVASDKPAGVIRINTTTDTVDNSFYYNIEQLAASAFGEELSSFQVWHIANNKFLIRFYDDSSMNFAKMRNLAIFDANAGTVSRISNFPSVDEISDMGRFIQIEDGKAYIPVTLTSSNPAVYVIDAENCTATKGIVVTADGGISAVGKLHN